MAGPPPPWAWRAESGYLPPANLWLPGDVFATPIGGAFCGPAPNPNVFFDMGEGPPGPMAPMQFGVAAFPAPAFVPVAPSPAFVPVHPTPAVQPMPMTVLCQVHHCPCSACGCYGPGLTHPNWRPGVNHLQSSERVTIEVHFESDDQWAENVRPGANAFHMFTVDCSWTFDNLMKHLMMVRQQRLGRGPNEPKDWALTEWHEKGGGTFSKGSMFKFGDKKADAVLAKVGWTKERGEAGFAPIRCQLHKAPAG